MNTVIRYARKLALALMVLGTIAFAQVASAAQIELKVLTKQYGYVTVISGSNTGGAIRWNAARGSYFTDRINRGERVYIFASPTEGDSPIAPALYGIWCQKLRRYLTGPAWAQWNGSCWYQEYIVPTNPNADNLYVDFLSNYATGSAHNSTVRIPIGYRKI